MPGLASHTATDRALQSAAGEAGEFRAEWVGTEAIETRREDILCGYDAFLCAPGSPYRSFAGALRALRFARESDRPLLGTCGGFQHMVIEFARNVLGRSDATHPEYNPLAAVTFITPMSCSSVGAKMWVRIDPSARVWSMYGSSNACETYRCNFEVNPEQQCVLHDAGLRIVGVNDQGHARIVELVSHPFYIGALFVPQMSSERTGPHPLIAALVNAAQARRMLTPAAIGEP